LSDWLIYTGEIVFEADLGGFVTGGREVLVDRESYEGLCLWVTCASRNVNFVQASVTVFHGRGREVSGRLLVVDRENTRGTLYRSVDKDFS
jgi:hypothetical protein